MNKQRRRALYRMLNLLETLDKQVDQAVASDILRDGAATAEQVMDEEQEALDNRPESLMFSSVNDDMNDNISDLQEVNSILDELADDCDKMKKYSYPSIKTKLTEAVNLMFQVIQR